MDLFGPLPNEKAPIQNEHNEKESIPNTINLIIKDKDKGKVKKIRITNDPCDDTCDPCDDTCVNGWSEQKTYNLKRWKNDLEYQWIINMFILYDLKDTESILTWIIIVISSLSSSLSIIQFGEEEYKWLEIYVKFILSILTILTTLIAAWLKKQNYVERINILDKYLIKVTTTFYELENILMLDEKYRINYSDYEKKYKALIIDLLSNVPSYSPVEYKKILYKITKYYPELVERRYPWYENEIVNDKNKMRDFGKIITNTYKSLKYYTTCSKIFSLYYCKFKCCNKNPNIFRDPTKVNDVNDVNDVNV